MGKIIAICTSEKKGVQKQPQKEAVLQPDWGILSDAHGGKWHRQISLLSLEKIEAFRQRGAEVAFGAFGENLVVSGFDLAALPVGTLLRCGSILLEVSQIGKECHNHCEIHRVMGDCIMPREGIFAKVLAGGSICEGDEIVIEPRTQKRPYQAAVITLSDKGSQQLRTDISGPKIVERLSAAGYEVVETILMADEKTLLKQHLMALSDRRQVDLILTTGGTGFGVRDITPEATQEVAHRNAPGIAEALRSYSLSITKHAMLSRGCSVIRKNTLIINLPGSPKACMEYLDFLLDTLWHGLDLLRSEVSDCADLAHPGSM
jgi:molybdenum cofactor synthesis domain-containing protein